MLLSEQPQHHRRLVGFRRVYLGLLTKVEQVIISVSSPVSVTFPVSTLGSATTALSNAWWDR
jgi:hypothetical protein